MASQSSQSSRKKRKAIEYDCALVSDVGRVRQKNEDSALIAHEHQLYVVADGMGGHSSGEVASQISVETVQKCFDGDQSDLRAEFKAWRESRTASERNRSFDEYRLWRALESANLNIFNTAARYSQFRDMGTTVVATLFAGKRVYIGYVGDSRVYRLRNGRLTQLTEDHSLANEYVKMKILRKEDLPRFPYNNVIVRALGLADSVEVDTFYRQVQPNDIYLLCSDGLTDLVSDDEICSIILEEKDTDSACKRLVKVANDSGGDDNITVLIVRVPGNSAKGK